MYEFFFASKGESIYRRSHYIKVQKMKFYLIKQQKVQHQYFKDQKSRKIKTTKIIAYKTQVEKQKSGSKLP